MKGAEGDARWIPVAEALEIYVLQLGLPDAFREALGAELHKPGIMWLSDHAITVYESPVGLAFDRQEFNPILDRARRSGFHERAAEHGAAADSLRSAALAAEL